MLHNITHIRETDSDTSPFIKRAVDVLYSVCVSDIDQCRQATGSGDTRLTSQGNEKTAVFILKNVVLQSVMAAL